MGCLCRVNTKANCRIAESVKVFSPDEIFLGYNVRIDEFCVLSGGKGIVIGSHVHVAVFCGFFGGGGIIVGDFVGFSSRCTLMSVSDDFSGESMTNPTIPDEFKNVHEGLISIEDHVLFGVGCTVLPGVTIGEGCAIGAHSLVKTDLAPWGIYAGTPARKIGVRSKKILDLAKQFLEARK